MKRSKGTGCIYQKNGWFYITFLIKGKRKDIALHTKDEKAANIKIKELVAVVQLAQNKQLLRSLLIGLSDDSYQISEKKETRKIKLKDVFQRYLSHPNKPDSGKGTLKNYERIWNKFASTVNYEYLEEIKEEDAITYAESLLDEQSSESTYNYHTGTLRLIFKTLLPKTENPFNGVKKKKVHSTKHKDLSEDELKRLISYTNGEIYILFIIGIYTGLRLIDAVKLRYEQIKDGIIYVKPVKTQRYGTEVQIPLHPQIQSAIKLSHDRCGYIMPELANLKPDALSGRVQAIFRNAGFLSVQSSDVVNGRQRKACLYGFHSLRHSFVSRLANAGVSLAIIGKMTGHASERMTDHYFAANAEALKKAIKSI